MSVTAPEADSSLDNIPGFEIDREIARGGMATVYLATQLSLDRKVALKVLRCFDNLEHKTRFINESRIIGSLNHRNAVTIFDVGNAGDRAFLSMEYLEGGDLSSRIDAGELDPCEALEIAAGIGDCLVFVHEQGIVHRDVKPANILFHRDGTPVLTDFGIATDVKLDSRLTACGATVGSPCYVSPEQAQGIDTDGRTDIYSLGIVLYEMLVGQPPFHEGSAIETMAAHLSLPPLRLPVHLKECQRLLDRMLAKNPDDRFATAADLVEGIRDLQISLASDVAPTAGMFKSSVQYGLLVSRKILSLASTTVRNHVHLRSKTTRLISAFAVLVFVGLVTFNGFREPDPVQDYLKQAEVSFDEDRLSFPKANNAFFYYREVLALDPGNEEALEGLHEIAEIYADRTERNLRSYEFSSAKSNLRHGLKVEPRNERLLRLSQETRSLRTLPEKVVRGIRSIFD
ncbi:MAG: serine/threonine-protein kinase [Gammaproteobacteria bacterium]|nr:serine/threonine-protein kinase [Gammaproteobacteria bacterium]